MPNIGGFVVTRSRAQVGLVVVEPDVEALVRPTLYFPQIAHCTNTRSEFARQGADSVAAREARHDALGTRPPDSGESLQLHPPCRIVGADNGVECSTPAQHRVPVTRAGNLTLNQQTAGDVMQWKSGLSPVPAPQPTDARRSPSLHGRKSLGDAHCVGGLTSRVFNATAS